MHKQSLLKSVFLTCVIYICGYGAASAQSAVANYRQTISSNGALPDSHSFGESINLMNGQVSFSTEDIRLKGIGPDIVVRRSPRTVRAAASAYAFGNWEIDLPKMEIVGILQNPNHAATSAPAENFWVDSVWGNSSTKYARCTNTPYPTLYKAFDEVAWNDVGVKFNDGVNESQLLRRGTQNTIAPGGQSASYPYIANQGQWQIGCLPTTSNGVQGEAFIAVGPDGTKYYLDYLYGMKLPDASFFDPNGIKPTWFLVERVVLSVTRAVDRFGNWVNYHYSGNHLTSIDSSDGRTLQINYDPTSNSISSIVTQAGTAAARTWSYQYGSPSNPQLSKVILPDSSTWEYSAGFQDFSANAPYIDPYNCKKNGDPTQTTGSQLVVKAPSNASATFNIGVVWHARSYVPTHCFNEAGTSYQHYTIAPVFATDSIVSRTITGPGLPAATWTYSYSAATGSTLDDACYQSGTCLATSYVDVTDPGGNLTRSTFSNRMDNSEGQLLSVDSYSGSSTLLKHVEYQYALATQGPYPAQLGTDFTNNVNPSPNLFLRPLRSRVIIQDGVTFSSYVNSYDIYARPLSVGKWSSLGYGKTDVTEYYDDTTHWVLGQVKRHYNADTNLVDIRNEYDPNTALVLQTYAFEKLKAAMTYNADGTLATSKDGNNNTTTYSNWKRGIPQTIQYADGTSVSAIVNDNGWVTAVTDENGYSTGYGYDAMGRVASIVYPNEPTFNYNTKTINFQATAGEWVPPGIQTGQWRRYEAVGNHITLTYYDAMWRPVLVLEYDSANVGGTNRYTKISYDVVGRKIFQSYPSTIVSDVGVRTTYDALSRVMQVQQDSELGALTSTTEYLTGFQVRTTNPRGYQTTNGYQAYDQPSYEQLAWSAQPENKDVTITRNFFGLPLTIKQADHANSAVSVTRSYAYDGYMQLCKTLEPETGATLMDYDAAGNLAWNASGLRGGDYDNASECTNSRSAAYGSGRRVGRNYDARNRITGLWFPDGKGSQSWTYTPDGLVATSIVDNDGPSAGSVDQAYTYNRRRLLAGESMSQRGWYTWGIGYGYDAYANVAANTYPDTFNVNFANNALGQPTQVTGNGTVLASGVSYYPNGGISQFTYGNGIVHTMTQNARQLPARSTDSGSTVDFVYTYDQNGNTTKINDWAQDGVNSGDALHIRYLYYDGLDRLTDAGSCSFGGDCWHRFHYNALDNITSWTLGGGVKDYANYIYDGNNRLTQINNTAGAAVVTLGYDAQGNLASKGGQSYTFDYGNRLKSVPGVAGYRYDAQGRRVLDWASAGNILPMYSMGGQLLFDENHRVVGTRASDYVYLSGSLLATYERNYSTGVSEFKYQHTDALGSPVAVTNQSAQVIERTNYEPYGNVIGRTNNDKPGYTGHVMDSATGLTYMQQRYYDPSIGRFLSTDPVQALGGRFSRYDYANNNPYRFTDPDGRVANTPQPNSGSGGCDADCKQARKQEEQNRWDAALGAVITIAGEAARGAASSAGRVVTAGSVGVLGTIGGVVAGMAIPAEMGDDSLTGVAQAQLARPISSWKPFNGQMVYRIWGGGSTAFGASWTPLNPLMLRLGGVDVRNWAGLPNGNTGQFMTTGILRNPAGVVLIRPADRLDGNIGGLIEYVIPNPANSIQYLNTVRVNPPF